MFLKIQGHLFQLNWIYFEEKEKAFYDISMLPPFSYILFTLVSENSPCHALLITTRQTEKKQTHRENIQVKKERRKEK